MDSSAAVIVTILALLKEIAYQLDDDKLPKDVETLDSDDKTNEFGLSGSVLLLPVNIVSLLLSTGRMFPDFMGNVVVFAGTILVLLIHSAEV